MASYTIKEITEFVEFIRKQQTQNGLSLRGGVFLKTSQLQAIQAVAKGCVVSLDQSIVNHAVKVGLLERFEEMCRRNNAEVPADMRMPLLEFLLAELAVNHRVVKQKVAKLVAVTAYCGSIGPALMAEFPDLAPTPNIIRQAMQKYPSDPRRFLIRIKQQIMELSSNDEFITLRESPSILRQAAMGYPGNPGDFLRKMLKNVEEISTESEFKLFQDTPHIIRFAALGYPSDPRKFLRKIKETVINLANEEEFSEFRSTPYIFKRAAITYSSDPRGFLRDVRQSLIELVKDPEFASLLNRPSLFKQAAIDHMSDPRKFLRTILNGEEVIGQQSAKIYKRNSNNTASFKPSRS